MPVYLVCYDIIDNRERTQVHRMLKRVGEPVQESVFELHRLGESALNALQSRLCAIVSDPASLRFYRLGADALAASRDLAGNPLARRPLFVIV